MKFGPQTLIVEPGMLHELPVRSGMLSYPNNMRYGYRRADGPRDKANVRARRLVGNGTSGMQETKTGRLAPKYNKVRAT